MDETSSVRCSHRDQSSRVPLCLVGRPLRIIDGAEQTEALAVQAEREEA